MKSSVKSKTKRTRVLYIMGIVALIIGVIDPLEGSIVIAIGSSMTSLSTYLTKNRRWKAYLLAFILILLGVVFMFYFSYLGGFGGESDLSWWWITLVIPYPIGWILSMYLLYKDR